METDSTSPLKKKLIELDKTVVQRLYQYCQSWFHPSIHVLKEQQQPEQPKDRKSRMNYCNGDFPLRQKYIL